MFNNYELFSLIINNESEKVDDFIQHNIIYIDKIRSYRDYMGDSFLHTASFFGKSHIVASLIKAGFDVNALNHRGQTSLHQTSDINVARILLESGANVNAKCKLMSVAICFIQYDWAEATALHMAAKFHGRGFDMIELLLSFDADINMTDADGKVPSDYLDGQESKNRFYKLIENCNQLSNNQDNYLLEQVANNNFVDGVVDNNNVDNLKESDSIYSNVGVNINNETSSILQMALHNPVLLSAGIGLLVCAATIISIAAFGATTMIGGAVALTSIGLGAGLFSGSLTFFALSKSIDNKFQNNYSNMELLNTNL